MPSNVATSLYALQEIFLLLSTTVVSGLAMLCAGSSGFPVRFLLLSGIACLVCEISKTL